MKDCGICHGSRYDEDGEPCVDCWGDDWFDEWLHVGARKGRIAKVDAELDRYVREQYPERGAEK